jgi:hypothetical protein
MDRFFRYVEKRPHTRYLRNSIKLYVGDMLLPPPLAGEGRGEGAFPQVRAIKIGHTPCAQTRGEAPSPGAQERADLSPQAGRGTHIRHSDVCIR